MATFADLKSRIQDDLDRTDIASQVGEAIRDAIMHYEADRFVFNEVTGVSVTFSSSAAVVALSSLSIYFTKIDRLRLRTSSVTTDLQDLIPRDYDWIMASQDANTVCRPAEYCVYAERINFGSMPDQNYTGVVDGVKRLDGSTHSYSNDSAIAWFNEGRNLIRARAKAELCAHVTRDDAHAQAMFAVADIEYRALKQKLNARNSGRVRPTTF